MGHSEVVTALRFTADCRRIISAGADGCIFVWRLHPDLTEVCSLSLCLSLLLHADTRLAHAAPHDRRGSACHCAATGHRAATAVTADTATHRRRSLASGTHKKDIERERGRDTEADSAAAISGAAGHPPDHPGETTLTH
jgi:hypothetical protein